MKFIGEKVAITAISMAEPYIIVGILISADSNFVYIDREGNGEVDCAVGVRRILAMEPYGEAIGFDPEIEALLEALDNIEIDDIPRLPEIPKEKPKDKKPSFEDFPDPEKDGEVQ